METKFPVRESFALSALINSPYDSLNEYAITFFSLVNAMTRIRAVELMEDVHANSIPQMKESDAKGALEDLKKSSQGVHGIVKEVRTAKRAKNVN
jgi:hypothetical protein